MDDGPTDGISPLEKKNKKKESGLSVVRKKGVRVERRLLEMPITYALTVLHGHYSLLLVTQIAVDERLM